MKKKLGLSILVSTLLLLVGCENESKLKVDSTSYLTIINGSQNNIYIENDNNINNKLIVGTNDIVNDKMFFEPYYNIKLINNNSSTEIQLKKDESNLLSVSNNGKILKDKGILINNIRNDIKLINLSNINLTSSNFPELKIIMKDGSKQDLNISLDELNNSITIQNNSIGELSGNIDVNLNNVESIAGQKISEILNNGDIDQKVINKLSEVGNMDFTIVVIDPINNIKVIPLATPKSIEDLKF